MQIIRAVILFLIATPCFADPASPFVTRDQNPFSLIHGLPAPTPATLIAAGNLRSTWSLNITNTINIDVTDNEFLFLDGEIYQSDVILDYGLNDDWNLRIDIPFIAYSGGQLDKAIESYHELLGFRRGERPNYSRDQLLFTYSRDGVNQVGINTSDSNIGDLQLIAGRKLKSGENTLSVWGSVKLPTGDSDNLSGNGATSLASWLSGRLSAGDVIQLYALGGLLYMEQGDVLSDLQEDIVLFGNFGMQWQYWDDIAIQAQIDWHTDFYKNSGSRLLGDVSQITFGAKFALSPTINLDFAIAEDIKVDASPDVNFNFALQVLHE